MKLGKLYNCDHAKALYEYCLSDYDEYIELSNQIDIIHKNEVFVLLECQNVVFGDFISYRFKLLTANGLVGWSYGNPRDFKCIENYV